MVLVTVSRTAAAKEKELMKAARYSEDDQQPTLLPPTRGLTSQQVFMEEENVNELRERERSIRQLEVKFRELNLYVFQVCSQ